jgi:pyruvate/2-oxoglutarate dehydrogenase complex dihydrolipoamide acyltransferase (E2) component
VNVVQPAGAAFNESPLETPSAYANPVPPANAAAPATPAPANSTAADRARRHTRYFLAWAHRAAPVHLTADINMTTVEAHRAATLAATGRRYSPVSYLVWAGGRVLAEFPEANASVGGVPGMAPRTVRHGRIAAKVALDHRAESGERAVLTAVLPDVDRLGLEEIQRMVDAYREGGAGAAAERVRLLGRLPGPLGRLAFRLAVGGPGAARRRPALLGTFAVSSLGGHPGVDGFVSYGGTAVTLSAGRTKERVVVRDGRAAVAPVLRLGLTFDHRVIDGGTAADILDRLVDVLEACDADVPGGRDGHRHRAGDRASPSGDEGRSVGPVHRRAA